MPDSDASADPKIRAFLRSAAGLLLILVVFVPLQLLRNAQEASLWCDEIYSLMLAHHELEDLVDMTAVDDHPPGYYILLKTWNRIGRELEIAPGVFWSRLPGTLGWITMLLFAWFILRGLLGPSGGTLACWALAASAQLLLHARNMRGYALALPALLIMFLLLAWQFRLTRRGAGRPWNELPRAAATAGWIVYFLCGALALWCHLLASFVLLFLGFSWLLLSGIIIARQGMRDKSAALFLWAGAHSHLFIILAFLPWLLFVPSNVAHKAGTLVEWATPPTLPNLLRVFLLWYPMGPVAGPHVAAEGLRLFQWLAALSALAPLSIVLYARFRPRGGPRVDPSPSLFVPLAGVLIPFLFTLTIWLIDRLTAIPAFDGTRYAAMPVGIWAIGLAAAVTLAARRLALPNRFAWLIMLPWFASSAVALAMEISIESRGGLANWIQLPESHLPPPGSDLYATPSELIPYFADSLAAYNVHRIEEIANVPDGTDELTILRLNQWGGVERERDAVILAFVSAGKLAAAQQAYRFPVPSYTQFVTHRLEGFDPTAARALWQLGYNTAPRDFPADTLLRMDAHDLAMRDGWNNLESDANRAALRWSRTELALAPLRGAISPGSYTLHLEGLRNPFPTEITTLQLRFRGEERTFEQPLPPTWFHLEIPIQIDRPLEQPLLELRHPVYSLEVYQPEAGDPRTVGFLLHAIYVTPPR